MSSKDVSDVLLVVAGEDDACCEELEVDVPAIASRLSWCARLAKLSEAIEQCWKRGEGREERLSRVLYVPNTQSGLCK